MSLCPHCLWHIMHKREEASESDWARSDSRAYFSRNTGAPLRLLVGMLPTIAFSPLSVSASLVWKIRRANLGKDVLAAVFSFWRALSPAGATMALSVNSVSPFPSLCPASYSTQRPSIRTIFSLRDRACFSWGHRLHVIYVTVCDLRGRESMPQSVCDPWWH